MARKPKGEGTISKLKDGSYCGRLTVGYDENGKQKRKAYYGKTKREVLEKMDAGKAEQNKTNFVIDPNNITVSEWTNIWIEEYKKRILRATTYHTDYMLIQKHINTALGAVKIKDLKAETVQKFINDLSDMKLSRATISKIMNNLRGALSQAVENGLLVKNVAEKIELPKEEENEMTVLSAEEQINFISIARNYSIGEMFILMLATGLRFGEVIALTWEDIDFDNSTLSVSKTYAHYYDSIDKTHKHVLHPPKTKASNRIIPILPHVLEMLKQRKLRSDAKIELVFTNDVQKSDDIHVNSYTATRRLNKYAKLAGITKRLNLHCLRHTFATRGLENGIELKVMQELLGHANISMTADIYTHVLPNKKKDSIMKLASTVSMSIDSKESEVPPS